MQNSDGTITMQLFVSDAVAETFLEPISNVDFVINYDSSQVGSIVASQLSAPSNPFISMANTLSDDEIFKIIHAINKFS